MYFSPPRLTDERAEELLAEIIKLTGNGYLKLERIDERFTGNPLDAWQLFGDVAAPDIKGSYKADVVIDYLDHLMTRFRSGVPSKPKLGERRDPVGNLIASLVLASLGVLKEEYLGT